jgi:hypothetical protein
MSRRKESKKEKDKKLKEKEAGYKEEKTAKEKEKGTSSWRSRADQKSGGDLEDRIAMMEKKIDR